MHFRAREISGTNPSSPRMRVALFPSCIIDRLLPDAGYAAARVLQAFGADIRLAYADACCGLPHLNSGDRDHAVAMARRAVEKLESVEADWITSASASCAITISDDYLRILDPSWRTRAERVAARVKPFTRLADQLQRACGTRGRTLPLRVTYHDACQSANVLGVHDEPRRLLRDVAGIDVIEMAESSVCCGFGGTFSFDYPEVATRILDRKLANAEATGADLIVTDNPGCLTHLRGGLDARSKRTRVAHLAEVLWESLRE
jgi:Fe-S oxidoreductase